MSLPHSESEQDTIRGFILKNIENPPFNISKEAAARFGVTRQAINKHIKKLLNENLIEEQTDQKKKSKSYQLTPLLLWEKTYEVSPEIAEDLVWSKDINKLFGETPNNIMSIWHYGFTEMLNNALDHSGGSSITIQIRKTSLYTEMRISDNGIGIFKKIQTTFNLLDESHAVLELVKGKLTTDPNRHTGEGIFFTSRMFDIYEIRSGTIDFSHQYNNTEDWIWQSSQFCNGTSIYMKLNNNTKRTTKLIFDSFTDDGDFNKTVVPVELAQYGNDELISRSQAKRLLARVELFDIVILDFAGVNSIGHSFADEIFRVFSIQHPTIELRTINEHKEVKKIINSVNKKKNNTNP